jgi:UDP-N-acetylmuramate: L-alanyl-gamma-D-glutamyl-meso-diaminopimelate ligase
MKKVHFIGIAGIGMSAVAVMLRDLGWEVSGSDDAYYPPADQYLKDAGIAFTTGYRAENIPTDASFIVLGRNAKLNPETNAEIKAALGSGIPVKSFAEVVGDLAKEKRAIVAAGSFGKSTSAALLAWCLVGAKRDPSWFVGAISPSLPRAAHIGKGEIFVLEGDEYPSSHEDPRSKFMHYSAHDLLLTGAAHDHVNIFPTEDSYRATFVELLKSIPKEGVILAAHEPEVFAVLEKAGRAAHTYSATAREADWHARDIAYGAVTRFSIFHHEEKVLETETQLLGEHHVKHAVGAVALLIETGIMSADELAAAIPKFKGVKRRMENVAPESCIPVYEGFGSSYEKARVAMDAMQLHFKDKRLVVVFEPHTFGWRNRANLGWYDSVFQGADTVFIAPPEGQGASTHAQLTHEEIVERARESGLAVWPFSLDKAGADTIVSALTENDAVLMMTSGGMGGLASSLPKKIAAKFPKPTT